MVDVFTEIEILCPKGKVSQFTSDPDNAPIWYKNIKSVTWQTPKPLRIGSKIAFVAHFMGRKLSYTYEVTALTNDKLIMRTAQGPFPMETTYEWLEIEPNTSRMLLRNKGNPSGFFRLLSPFISKKMREANKNDLKCLKQILEKN